MATHPSILAWGILWTEEPGGLQSLGSQRSGNNWATKQQQHKGMVLLLWRSRDPVTTPRQSSRDRRHTLNWVTQEPPCCSKLRKCRKVISDQRQAGTLSHWGSNTGATYSEQCRQSGFPGGSESACSVGDLGLIPRSRRSPGEGSGQGLSARVLETASSLQRLLKRWSLSVWPRVRLDKNPLCLSGNLLIYRG